jgi:tetratricopeptide (TPR) repeat protein
MTSKCAVIFGCAALSFAPWGAVVAQEAASAAAAKEEKGNAALDAEIAYVEALIDAGYPDYAAPVIAETKKKWPESEARFFAIEIRGLLSLGKFDEAEKKIAALPDRNGSKFWAARLVMANNYFGRGQKAECMKIYDEFFKVFPKPPKDIRQFHLDASYAFGQLLFLDKQYAKASTVYANLLKEVPADRWCDIAAETVKIYLTSADSLGTDPKNKAARDGALAAAEKLVDQLLWHLDKPVFFGQAVSMKAHIEVMRGRIARAQEIVSEYLPNLRDIHKQLLDADPDGRKGYLKLSPLPECLYLQAKMLWDTAKAEMKKTTRDDERIKSLMFGERNRQTRKRNGQGAFNLAVTVFLNYEMSPWAAPAGELSEEVKAFAEKTYNAKIKTAVTPEQIAKVRAAQFKSADEKFMAGQMHEAIKEYYELLARYPELPESIRAIANIVTALQDLIVETKDAAKKDEYRTDADAVSDYLSERFAGHPDRVLMTEAGNAVIRLASREQERGQLARADRLFTAFICNYRDHINAPVMASQKAMENQKAGKYRDAVRYWNLISTHYTNAPVYAASLAQLSYCYGKLGDRQKEIDYIKSYLPLETVKLRRLQGEFRLAQMYRDNGLEILKEASLAAETNATADVVAAVEKQGSAQIVRAIMQFMKFSSQADTALKDPGTPKGDLPKYKELREGAMFLTGLCWSRINRPEENLAKYRARAAAAFEAYLQAYPKGKYAKAAYVSLGTIYTALNDLAKSKDALDRLSRLFPDSEEAKNAKPRLAKSLIEMGMRKEGTEIYAEMLRTDGAYTARQFLDAGEALIEAKSWETANQSFQKAIKLASTNSPVTVARARLGEAKCAFRQGAFAEAREALDTFLADAKMSRLAIAADANFLLVDVAKAQGRTEKDATMRAKHFGTAVGALKKVRAYWSKKPQWEQDSLDLLSGDVLVARMNAEESMGLKEEAKESCARAASTFQVFIQSHGVSAEHPADKMSAGELANLERAYATMVPLFAKMGAEQADRVMTFGQQYLDLFPSGKDKTEIINCMNRARADLPAAGAAPAATDAP